MRFKFFLLTCTIFAALSVSMSSCADCENTDPIPTAPVRFVIVDPEGQNLVTDTSSRYQADSIQLKAGKQDFIISRTWDAGLRGYVFESYPYNDDSGKSTLLLYFNHLDTDTLTTFYSRVGGDCGFHYDYSKIEHNGKEIGTASLSGIIRIVKPN